MSAMSASEDFRIVQMLNFWLGMFANIIPSSSAVVAARLFEAELRHDGAEAAGIGILLEVAKGALVLRHDKQRNWPSADHH